MMKLGIYHKSVLIYISDILRKQTITSHRKVLKIDRDVKLRHRESYMTTCDYTLKSRSQRMKLINLDS
jgi:hypothetical protein